MRRSALTHLLWGVAALSARTALAQTPVDTAAAASLFDEGRTLMAEGRWADARERFARSDRLQHALGTAINIAECDARLGRSASAWAEYRGVVDEAHRAGDALREKVAGERVTELEPTLSRLTVDVPAGDDVPGFVLRRDGATVDRVEWGVAVPVDPGQHELDAQAPGRQAWHATLRVEAGARGTLQVPVLATSEQRAAPAPRRPAPIGTQRIVAVAIGAAGLIGVGVGAFFAVQAQSTWNDALGHCRADGCDAQGVSLGGTAQTQSDVATVAFGAAAACTVAGAVLWLTGRPETTPSTSVRLVPWVGAGIGGVSAVWAR